MEDEDLALALALQEELNSGSPHTPFPSQSASKNKSKNFKSPSLVDEFWELSDPNPDIRGLFLQFNERFFWGRLAGIEVKWSPRMTSCAGICCYEGRGGLCSVRLSTPLLKLRPRKDLVETLLHEMIHAYLFVTENNKDRDGHGPEFHKHMYRINAETGTNISVYHTFHDEVELYKTHWWKCNGRCQKQKPYYGMVKRSMNRAPSKNDTWWEEHQKTCGGKFIKVKEPEGYSQKKKGDKNSEKGYKSDSEIEKKKSKSPDIRSFWGKGQPVKNDKPATAIFSDVGKSSTNEILVKKGSGDGKNKYPSTSKPPVYMGDNSAKPINSDYNGVNIPNIRSKGYDSDSNVMKAKTIWNIDKEQPVSKPSLSGNGQILGKGDKHQMKNNLTSVNTTKSSNDSDLNVMKAKTIWNKDQEETVKRPAFIGQGNTLGQAEGGLSWLAQFRKGITASGSKNTPKSTAHINNDTKHRSEKTFGLKSEKENNVSTGQKRNVIQKQNDSKFNPSDSDFKFKKRKELFDSYFEVGNKPITDSKSGNKIKKAVLVFSESDEDDPEPISKKIRRSNSPDVTLPTISSPTSRKSQDFREKTQGNSIHSNSSSSNLPNSAINTIEAVPMANCPVCQMEVSTVEINNHLDQCLSVS